MAILFSDQGRTPLLDQGMSVTVRRRLNEMWGILLGVAAALLATALLSYNVGDPSLFSATQAPATNWLGEAGAVVADAMMRYAGLGSWALVAFLGVWSVRFLLHIGEQRIWARSLLALPALAFAPVFASTHAVYEGWPLLGTGLGGLLGDSGGRMLLDLVPIPDPQALPLVALGLAVCLLLVGGAALGFTLREVSAISSWMSRSLRTVVGQGGALAIDRGRRGIAAARTKIQERNARPRSEKMGPAEPAGAWRRRMMGRLNDVQQSVSDATSQMPGVKIPKVSVPKVSVPNVAIPSMSMPSVPGLNRKEPAITMDRISGAAEEIENKPEIDSGEVAPDELRTRIVPRADGPATVVDDPSGATSPSALRTVFDRLADLGDMRAPAPDPAAAVAPFTEPAPQPGPDYPAETPVQDAAAMEPPKTPVERRSQPRRISKKAEAERQPKLALDEDEPETFELPPLGLLAKPVQQTRSNTSDVALEENARMLETVLEDYGVRGEIVAVRPGPVVTLYELEPAPGLKASRVIGLADDIARSMSALAARVSTVPGRSIIGIELPNAEREKVWLRDVFETREYGDARFPLTLALGKDISGAPIVSNLAKMPHLLIAGTTGSGKSVAINTMILSLLYRLSPEQCRLIMIDPKMLELSVYDNIPHLLAPVVTDPKKAVVALKWVVAEMEDRYRKMSRMGVRNIDGYNARVREALEKGEDFSRTVQTGFDEATGEPVYETEVFEPQEMPFIVVIVDEMADLMMVAGKEIEACIQRLAQMARASGIHLIMATQRPSVDVITGTIKANFPTRISFQVTSKIDSRTILGEQGAEQLLGMGDMLYMEGGGRIRRVHGPFVSDEEVEEIVQHLRSQGVPSYVEAVTDGVDDEEQAAVDLKLGLAQPGDTEAELYDRAVAIVARDRKCSTSYVQRKLAIGYNKAARLVEQMEEQGVVTPANAVGKREILIEAR